jgi:hypothetical protein
VVVALATAAVAAAAAVADVAKGYNDGLAVADYDIAEQTPSSTIASISTANGDEEQHTALSAARSNEDEVNGVTVRCAAMAASAAPANLRVLRKRQ